MKYSVFLSDFDGTLVRKDGTVSQKNLSAIRAYREKGGTFAVVTGRMTASILPRLKELGLDGVVCAYQGAAIADIGTGKLLRDEAFGREEALRVIRYLEGERLHIHVYTADEFYSNSDDELLRQYERICGVKGKVERGLSDMVASKAVRVVKVLAMVPPSEREAVFERARCALPGIYVTCSSSRLVEFMPEGQNKAQAVEFLSGYFRVPREKIAAIGDQLNDLPMLGAAGGRFAVANAEPRLKENAVVVSSCEEDGVAEAIAYAMGDEI